ncbi:MAG: hypothetical protein LBR36_03560 [Bacteroidales bacterium]|jgi:heptosyltransferase-2|nr:hypothetical protein [Bacteroidales bacterium]
MSKILIIKTGATGDVVRTTVLLHALKNEQITWITAQKNKCVLPANFPALQRILAIEDITFSTFENDFFDLVLSLDDDADVLKILPFIKCKKITGAYITQEGKITYSDDSSAWFDLSLISRFSKDTADKLKYDATCSVQEYLYQMIGKTFTGEEYVLPEDTYPTFDPLLVGIEARAGERWQTKRWNGYTELSENLLNKGYKVRFFQERETIREYMYDIAQCGFVITGDTLAMHFALGLKIPTVAIFTCTSPVEIYDYNRMQKVISPHLWEAWYTMTYYPLAVESITQEMVWNAVEKMLKIKRN